MSHRDKSVLNKSAPENPGRRAFFVIAASFATTYYLTGVNESAPILGAAQSSSASAAPTNSPQTITVDSTKISIGTNEHI